MSVLVKLKRLQEVLKRNGRMKVVYEELLESTERRRTLSEEQEMSIEELEKTLQMAKEAVVKAVMGGLSRNATWDDSSILFREQREQEGRRDLQLVGSRCWS